MFSSFMTEHLFYRLIISCQDHLKQLMFKTITNFNRFIITTLILLIITPIILLIPLTLIQKMTLILLNLLIIIRVLIFLGSFNLQCHPLYLVPIHQDRYFHLQLPLISIP